MGTMNGNAELKSELGFEEAFFLGGTIDGIYLDYENVSKIESK